MEPTCRRRTSGSLDSASPRDLLARAFVETYGLEMQAVFADADRSIATYRYAVSEIIPSLTEAAWRDKHDEIVRLHPDLQRTGFVFGYGRAAFEREYGRNYERPGWFARFLGFIYRILPKIGPLKPLSFKTPSAEAEALFGSSFRDASARLRADVRAFAGGRVELSNTNFDTGRPSRAWRVSTGGRHIRGTDGALVQGEVRARQPGAASEPASLLRAAAGALTTERP